MNCFGGILSLEKVAVTLGSTISMGILKKPVVLRYKGLNLEKALEAIEKMKEMDKCPEIHIVDDFDEAAKKSVEIAAEAAAKKTADKRKEELDFEFYEEDELSD